MTTTHRKKEKFGSTSFSYICKTMKIAFKNEKAAKTYINQVRGQKPWFTAKWLYKCSFCHFYHITSRKPFESA